MAHTPGPWYVNGDCIEADGPEGPRDLTVALVVPFHQKERQANARLIAAAPELLDACRQLARHFGTQADTEDESDALWAAKSAISKAEGRSK